MRVVNASMISDGTCPSCRAGRVTQCEGRSLFGYSGVYPRLDGGQAELVRVPQADRALRALPDEVGDEAAVFLADILPTGYGAVVRGGVSAGDTVVVVGCGPVGLMAVLCAVGDRGQADRGRRRRRPGGELAEQLGAEAVEPERAADAVAEATGGLGADVVIEAAGSAGRPRRLAAARARARRRLGRRRALRARLSARQRADVRARADAPVLDRRSDRRRCDCCSASSRAESSTRAPVVTHRLPLADAAEAYRLFDSREATKVVLTP